MSFQLRLLFPYTNFSENNIIIHNGLGLNLSFHIADTAQMDTHDTMGGDEQEVSLL